MSRGSKYVFDEAQDEQAAGFGMPSSYSYQDRPRWGMDAIPASTEGEGTKMGVSIFDELSKEAFLGIGFEPMAIDLPMI